MHAPGPIAQSVASPIADPGVMSSIQARFHTFVEIDHEIISTVILFGLVSITSKSMCKVLVNCLVKLAHDKARLG